MIQFSIEPSEELAAIVSGMTFGFAQSWFNGIMDDAYQYQLNRKDDEKPLRIYLVCKLEANDVKQVYSKPLAVVAFNEADACDHYFDWTGDNGSCIGVISYNAGKEKVGAPRS